MRVKYIGKSFGVDSLTDQREYEVVAYEDDIGALRIIDDSGEDYLYSPRNPRPIAVPDHPGGHFEIIEDDENQTLRRAIHGGIDVNKIWDAIHSEDPYFGAHSACSNHMEALSKDKVCGCFYCLRIFDPALIEEWIIDDNPIDRGGTAVCPHCGVDSVIGESSGYPITEKFLRGMKQRWFNE